MQAGPEDQAGAYRDVSGYYLRGRFMPTWLLAVCGAILVAGLAWSLFGNFSSADEPGAEAALETSADPSADQTGAAGDAASTLEQAADALEAAGESLEAAELTNGSEALSDTASSSTTEATPPQYTPRASTAVARFSCRVQGIQVEAWRCITAPDDSTFGGSLKIAGSGTVRRYGPNEVIGLLASRNSSLTLPSDYSVEVQPNGDSDYTLRLDISEDGTTVFGDETSEGVPLSATAGNG